MNITSVILKSTVPVDVIFQYYLRLFFLSVGIYWVIAVVCLSIIGAVTRTYTDWHIGQTNEGKVEDIITTYLTYDYF